ncbi:MAG TPA: hypothetical protein VI756_01855, partial [Blastocatellia bacterium]
MKHRDKNEDDGVLGMSAQISRRDFMNGVLLSGAGLWAAGCAPREIFGVGEHPSNAAGDGSKSGWG